VHIHILGVCGTFMAGVAILARQMGHRVSGSDRGVYPPMSIQLGNADIELMEGYAPAHLDPAPDLVVVGNALSRGNAIVEDLLNRDIAFTSGPQWLAENVLRERWTLAVAGTHGKTTTASILAWILEHAGIDTGFLIGGIPTNFGMSSRLGTDPFFVVEADEYDTAFFDKRSKFVHYRPRTTALTNLEFDHADIFDSLDDIKRQFHHLIRTIPSAGRIIFNGDDAELTATLQMGCWTPLECFVESGYRGPLTVETQWSTRPQIDAMSQFEVIRDSQTVGMVNWPVIGRHNMQNALAAIAAAHHAGVSVESSCSALTQFRPVKRRLELIANIGGISVYDDFAHHPTAIRETLNALRAKVGSQRIIAILEPRSNSMRMGTHNDALASSLAAADQTLFLHTPELTWDVAPVLAELGDNAKICDSAEQILDLLSQELRNGDHAVIMTNGDFAGLRRRLLERLQ